MRKVVIKSILFLALGLLLAGLPRTAGAQTGPGGISSGLQMWLKADTGVETDTNGTSVTAWRDQSGNHFDMVYPIPSAVFKSPQPVVYAPGKIPAAVNGLPVVRFNGNHCLAYAGAVGLAGTGPVTVFIYTRVDNTGVGIERDIFYLGSKTGVSGARIGFSADSSVRFNGANNIWGGEPLSGTFHLGTWQWSSNSSSGATFYRDGVLATDGVVGTPTKVLSMVDECAVIGMAITNSGGSGQQVLGDVAEVIYYNRTLSAAERQAVESYLTTKYTLAPPTQAIAVSPATVTFSNINVVQNPTGMTTATVTITNGGTIPLNFQTQPGHMTQGLVMTGNGTITINSVTPATTSPLAAGASVTVVLKYQPGAQGNHTATLSVFTDDPVAPKIDVPIAGMAVPVKLSHFAAE